VDNQQSKRSPLKDNTYKIARKKKIITQNTKCSATQQDVDDTQIQLKKQMLANKEKPENQ